MFAALYRGAMSVTRTYPSGWAGSNVCLRSRSFYSSVGGNAWVPVE